MIKVNVIVKNKTWLRFIKNPEAYLKKKLKKFKATNFLEKKNIVLALNYLIQMR